MWSVERVVGDPGRIHARVPADDIAPTLWVVQTSAPALVLGSTQRDDVVDADACRAAGIDVVRRRSGGSAVLVVPGEMLWVDVILPSSHPAWDDDVVRSAWWIGDIWSAALGDLGVTGTRVHHGALVPSPLSPLVCFAGMGAGEVMVGDAKLVGISQRRTRHHARFQCLLHHVWRPETIDALLLPDPADAPGVRTSRLAAITATCDVSDDEMVRALLERLDGAHGRP